MLLKKHSCPYAPLDEALRYIQQNDKRILQYLNQSRSYSSCVVHVLLVSNGTCDKPGGIHTGINQFDDI